MTQRDDLEPIGGLGTAATKGGSVKSPRLGQICVGANIDADNLSKILLKDPFERTSVGPKSPFDSSTRQAELLLDATD